MSVYVPVGLRRQVVSRDQGVCAYCYSAERLMGITFEIDHITPEAFGGATELNNLCLACPACNRYKATRLTAVDPDTGIQVRLFHPLQDRWQDHFTWMENSSELRGLTPVGRATIAALNMNRATIVQLRGYWVALGLHPPAILPTVAY